MNKTIFQIDYKLSVLIVSILGIVVGFISNAYNVTGITSLIFYFIKSVLLTSLYLIFYLMENKNSEFKSKLKYMVGSLVLLIGGNIVFSIFIATHILSYLFLTLTGLVSLYVIILFTLEILSLYIKNNGIEKVVSFNKKIGTAVADPIVRFFESKITNG